MSLADDFRSLLTGVRDIAESPMFKDAVSRDIAALEQAAENGLEAVERHVTGWFGTVYGADPGTGAQPVTPAAPVDAGLAADAGTPQPAAATAPGELPGQEALPGS